jgi:hypothetical protein
MNDYVGIMDVATKIFTWHWSIIGWAIAFVLIILLLTKLWHYVWELALAFALIGWLCAAYAGLTGNWFIGWFAWTIFLSVTLFIRFTVEYMMRLPDVSDKKDKSQ